MRWLWQGFDRKSAQPDPGMGRAKEVRTLRHVLLRSLWTLIKLNLLILILLLPSAILLMLSVLGIQGTLTFALAVLTACPLGGAVSAGLFVVANALRDESGVPWNDFWRKFAETFWRALIPGMVSAVFLYAQVHLWSLILFDGNIVGRLNVFLGVVSLLVFSMLAPYVFLQIAYVDLSVPQIFRNAVLIAFGNLPRSLMGALTGCAIWVVFVLLLPASLAALPLIALLGISLSWFLSLMWIWPVLDNQFAIDRTLRERRAETGPQARTVDT